MIETVLLLYVQAVLTPIVAMAIIAVGLSLLQIRVHQRDPTISANIVAIGTTLTFILYARDDASVLIVLSAGFVSGASAWFMMRKLGS